MNVRNSARKVFYTLLFLEETTRRSVSIIGVGMYKNERLYGPRLRACGTEGVDDIGMSYELESPSFKARRWKKDVPEKRGAHS